MITIATYCRCGGELKDRRWIDEDSRFERTVDAARGADV